MLGASQTSLPQVAAQAALLGSDIQGALELALALLRARVLVGHGARKRDDSLALCERQGKQALTHLAAVRRAQNSCDFVVRQPRSRLRAAIVSTACVSCSWARVEGPRVEATIRKARDGVAVVVIIVVA